MIDGISGKGAPIQALGQRKAPAATTGLDPARISRTGPAPGPAPAPATSILTNRSSHSALVADMAKAPPVNAARVADLKARIDAGTYSIDPARIADAMLKLDRGRP